MKYCSYVIVDYFTLYVIDIIIGVNLSCILTIKRLTKTAATIT